MPGDRGAESEAIGGASVSGLLQCLVDEIATEAATRAAAVGSGRVGRTQTLSLGERAALAARALIRHRHTSYEEDLFDPSIDDPWDEGFWYREIKAEANRAVDDFLDQHRPQGSVTYPRIRNRRLSHSGSASIELVQSRQPVAQRARYAVDVSITYDYRML